MKESSALDQGTPNDHLTRAMEELRGVLHEEDKRPEGASHAGINSSLIMNIPVEVQIVLGSTEMPVSELLTLQKGSTVALNRRIGEPVDVVVNGRRVRSRARQRSIAVRHQADRDHRHGEAGLTMAGLRAPV
jgi:flagellar motor switch protein FliN/FliY